MHCRKLTFRVRFICLHLICIIDGIFSISTAFPLGVKKLIDITAVMEPDLLKYSAEDCLSKSADSLLEQHACRKKLIINNNNPQ